MAGGVRAGRGEGGAEHLDAAVADDAGQQVERGVAERGRHGQRGRVGVHAGDVPDVPDPALAQHHGRRRERQRLVRVGGGPEHDAARAGEHGLQVGAQLLAQLEVQVGQGLVEQQQVHGAGQGAGDGGALLLPARQLGGPAPQQLGQAHELGHLAHPAVDAVAAEARVEAERGGDVLVDGQRRVIDELLIDEGDRSFPHRYSGDVFSVDRHPACLRGQQSGGDAHQRRLSRHHRADDGGHSWC